MIYIIAIIISYLLGSVPFGLILTRLAGRGDLRKVGSGNIGATNVMRVGGLRMAGMVWLLDMLKAMVAVFIGTFVSGSEFGALCGFFAVVGHCYPVWLGFHGGKGISSLFGILLAINPILFVICGIEWLVVALVSGFSSLGATVVFCLIPIFGFVVDVNIGIVFLLVSLLCMWRHRENIVRLCTGAESKIVWRWKK